MNIDRYMKVINGEEHLSTEAVGILCGRTPEEIKEDVRQQMTALTGRFVPPPSWRRGAKEMQAKYGTDSAPEILVRVLAERGEL